MATTRALTLQDLRGEQKEKFSRTALAGLDPGKSDADAISLPNASKPTGIVTLQDYREEQREKFNRSALAGSPDSGRSDAGAISLPNASPTAAAPPKGRVVKAAMMSGAQGIVLTGGHFTNVGGNVYRGGRNRAAPRASEISSKGAQEPVVGESREVSSFDNASRITAKGPGVRIDNSGGLQDPGTTGSVHAHMFTNLKDSEFHSGVFTNTGGAIFEGDDDPSPVATPVEEDATQDPGEPEREEGHAGSKKAEEEPKEHNIFEEDDANGPGEPEREKEHGGKKAEEKPRALNLNFFQRIFTRRLF